MCLTCALYCYKTYHKLSTFKIQVKKPEIYCRFLRGKL